MWFKDKEKETFEAEMSQICNQLDWLQRVIDRKGLAPGIDYSLAEHIRQGYIDEQKTYRHYGLAISFARYTLSGVKAAMGIE